MPHIDLVFPPGGRQGTTVNVVIRGEELEQVNRVYFHGRGVEGKIVSADDEGIKLAIAIAPDAPPGPHDMRISRATGLSNRFRFFVSEIPEINAELPRAKNLVQTLPPLPVLVNGWIMPAETHAYRFAAKAGEKIVCRVQSQEIIPLMADAVPGWPQVVLTLHDPEGKEIAFVDNAGLHPDPVLIQAIPRDGQYRLELRDALYRGRENFLYRLSMGTLPHLERIYPLGGQAGQATRVSVLGVNLPADFLAVTPPAGAAGIQPVFLKGQQISNAMPYQVQPLSATAASAATTRPQQLTLPTVVDGHISRPGEEATFSFHASAKQQLVLEVWARRLDSPLDSCLAVFDAKGVRLGQNDDFVDECCPMVLHQADSRLSVKFPSDGEYTVRLGDSQNRGGPEYAYRLMISPPRPDFALMVQPDNPRIAAGGRTVLGVHAVRRDNFDGEIRLSIQGLPPGFAAGDAVIQAKETDARFVISAPQGAKPGELLQPIVRGEAVIEGRTVAHEAMPTETLMQAFSFTQRVPTEELLLQVTPASPFVLDVVGRSTTPPAATTSPTSSASAPTSTQAASRPITFTAIERPCIQVPQDGLVSLVVQVRRSQKMAGPIALTLDQPAPKGVTMKWTSIPPDKDLAEVTLMITRQAVAGKAAYPIITGTGRSGGAASVEFAAPLAIKVLPAPTTAPASRPATRPATQTASKPQGKVSTSRPNEPRP